MYRSVVPKDDDRLEVIVYSKSLQEVHDIITIGGLISVVHHQVSVTGVHCSYATQGFWTFNIGVVDKSQVIPTMRPSSRLMFVHLEMHLVDVEYDVALFIKLNHLVSQFLSQFFKLFIIVQPTVQLLLLYLLLLDTNKPIGLGKQKAINLLVGG